VRYARYQITRKPRQVFKYPKLMLGKGADCPVKKWYKDHFYPYELEAAEDGRGGIQLSVPGGGGFDALNYTAEALVGQILFHARVMAEKTAEETVKETVITVSFRGGDGGGSRPAQALTGLDVLSQVPPFWGQDQRQAIMDAAELAGLKVLSLMNENTAGATCRQQQWLAATAVATGPAAVTADKCRIFCVNCFCFGLDEVVACAVAMKYAIDRKFENTKEHNVIFYDMGATSLKTSFVTFSAYDVLDGKKNKTVGEGLSISAWPPFRVLEHVDSLGSAV
jgi:molecular chaperone DnaK (HSP70)